MDIYERVKLITIFYSALWFINLLVVAYLQMKLNEVRTDREFDKIDYKFKLETIEEEIKIIMEKLYDAHKSTIAPNFEGGPIDVTCKGGTYDTCNNEFTNETRC